MKNFLNNSFITIKKEDYLKLIIILVPLLNLMPGFNFDLYTPSMPALAHYFATSVSVIKNTVTSTLIGFAIGGFVSGFLLDILGRRSVILFALIFYIAVSIAAIFCHSIEQLLIIRFIQGFLAATFTIGCRAIIIDHFKGHEFNVAMLYTSLSYGIGPIIGPFIGGILQHHLGWKANFIAYAIMGFIFFCLYAVFVEESIVLRNSFSPKRLYRTYKELLTHRVFIVSIFLVGCCQIQLMTYATVGSFIVQNILHRTAIVYGNSALLIGVCYFSGTLTNRFLIKKWHVHHLSQMGLILLVLSSTLQLLLAHFGKFDLFNLVLPVMMICYCLGILFPTLSLRSLKIFPQYAGIATSVLICFGLGIASIGMFLISFIDINDLMRLSLIFLSVTILHCIAFYGFLNKRDAALA
ncbi:MAG: hypothetical protein A3E81_01985 [Gammaproteobacteria bacterium RIFCSPHIGHO2_12_FULL_36_30]|nr:MAG: hypothetical protein A3E81_01985 [Gammaproteobacteria bacterium RIFCSPHIGHO2_12_FULL_36_30]